MNKQLLTRAALALTLSALPALVFGQAAQGGGGIQRERTVPVIASGKWTGKRLADGQPDVQGQWSNTIANHNNWTDPQGGVPGDPNPRARPTTARSERAPS